MPLNTDGQIGPYQIIRPIGHGGMGDVLLGHDNRLDRHAAIKVLPDSDGRVGDDTQQRERFLQEARSASAIVHPNVCVIYDIGETEDGRPFVAMEFIEGRTVRELNSTGPISIELTIEFACQIADALEVAHETGVVHRDIKPANVLITPHSRAKVLDFGLATARVSPFDGESVTAVADEFRTQAGTVMGTVGYMSPEQVRGEATDARSDLFSLGAVLYEMAAGTRAFNRDTAVETMTAIINDPLPTPSRTELPNDDRMYDVISRCLAKAPEDRFEPSHDLLNALKGAGHPNAPSQSSLAPLLAGIAAVAVVAIVALVLLNRGDNATEEARPFESVEFEFQNDRFKSATREDFEDFCEFHVGRWTGEVSSVIGETIVTETQKEDRHLFLEFRRSEGGHALIFEAVSARTKGSGRAYYNAAMRQIRVTTAGSEGVVNQDVICRDADKWIRHTEQTAVNGTIREFYSIVSISKDGNTMTVRIIDKHADGESVEQTNVWHRVGE